MERGSLARRSLAVPAAVLELLPQQAVDQPIARLAEIGACPQDCSVDAGLRLAFEERAAVELVPSNAITHEADRPAGFRARRIDTQILQQHEGVDRGHPAFIVGCAPLAAGCLKGEEAGAPTLRRNA